MAEQYSTVYMYHIFSIHSSIDGHFSCFHVLAIVNSAPVNTGVNVMCLFDYGFLRAYANKGTAVSYGSFFPNVLGNLHTVLHSGYINLHSHQQCKRFPFSPTLSLAFIVCRYFDDGHSD